MVLEVGRFSPFSCARRARRTAGEGGKFAETWVVDRDEVGVLGDTELEGAFAAGLGVVDKVVLEVGPVAVGDLGGGSVRDFFGVDVFDETGETVEVGMFGEVFVTGGTDAVDFPFSAGGSLDGEGFLRVRVGEADVDVGWVFVEKLV